MRRLLATTLLATIVAGQGLAENIALVIGNGSYAHARNITAASRNFNALTQSYQQAGYEVISGRNLTRDEMRDALARFEDRLEDADQVIVHIAGYGITADQPYLVPTDLDVDSRSDLAFDALPVSSLLDMLADRPGRSALFLGLQTDGFAAFPEDSFAIPDTMIPQGVLVVSAVPQDITRALRQSFLEEGVGVAEAVARFEDLKVQGYVSPVLELAALEEPEAPSSGQPDGGPVASIVERTLWSLAEQNPTEANLRTYLNRFPRGAFADEARAKLEEIENNRVDPAVAAEQELNLSRNARRAVQEQLTILDFDTRGVDGIFGNGTRGAIRAWQKSQRLEETGYLDAAQLELLSTQASRRSDEIKAEAEERKREEELADIAFWRATGASGEAADLRAYLSRYPEGIYADEARRALEPFEEEERDRAEAEERRDWDVAREANTISAYRAFLAKYPRGSFAENAKARIEDLTRETSEEDRQAEYLRIERSLGLPGASIILVEQKLRFLGLDPGTVDGRITNKTRRAIKRFQQGQGMTATGYLTAQTLQRLLVATR